MSVLSAESEQQIEDLLVKTGKINADKLQEIKTKADSENSPLLSYLVIKNIITDEILTEMIAKVNNIPYVNLSAALVNPKTLDLLRKDLVERYMAVPLGEVGNRLAVAMLDADNLQELVDQSKYIWQVKQELSMF